MTKVAVSVAILSLLINLLQYEYTTELERQKEVYDWKWFTCKTIFDEPANYAIAITKWNEAHKKYMRERAK